MTRRQRRLVVGAGFGAIVIASGTACIFEKSTYQGGGRLDKGASANTGEPTASSTPTTPEEDASPPDPFADAPDG